MPTSSTSKLDLKCGLGHRSLGPGGFTLSLKREETPYLFPATQQPFFSVLTPLQASTPPCRRSSHPSTDAARLRRRR
ncbi:hypothetical protein EE612_056008 [Oryza sativa]|nr:hypothetical protein EE612_056008 [Oryza sativa]